jgi:hypothetical protein
MLRSEQETTFRWAADEDMVSIWTAQAPVRRKLEKAGYRPYRASREGGEVLSGSPLGVPLAGQAERRGLGGPQSSRRTPRQRHENAKTPSKFPGNSYADAWRRANTHPASRSGPAVDSRRV